MDVVIHCRGCGWDSEVFAFEAVTFRQIAMQHFAYIPDERIYACRGGKRVLKGQGGREPHSV